MTSLVQVGTITEIRPHSLVLRFKDRSAGILHNSRMGDILRRNFKSLNVGDKIEVTYEKKNEHKSHYFEYLNKDSQNMKILNSRLQENVQKLSSEIEELTASKQALQDSITELTVTKTLHRAQVSPELTPPPESASELPAALQSLLWYREEEPLEFELAQLRELLASIATAPLTVLSGPSGTGKSAICRAFERHFQAGVEICPVQSNWVSSAQLLGYHNPLNTEKDSWVSTPLYHFLQGEPRSLRLAVLDEMNLAYVEHYLADLLSKLASPERPVQLALSGDPKGRKLSITHDVRLVGTVNIDETTHQLSPKVIDRACVLTFTNPLLRREEDALIAPPRDNALKLISPTGELPQVGAWLTSPLTVSSSRDELVCEMIEPLISINRELLQELGPDVSFSFRTLSQLKELLHRLLWLGASQEEALDSASRLKLLPRLRFFDSSDRVRKVMEELKERLESIGATQAASLTDKITTRAQEQRGAYDFWRY